MTIKTGSGFVFAIASGIALAGCMAAAPDEVAPAAGTQQGAGTAALTPISIHTDEGAGLILYREGADGPWLAPPPPLKPGEYEVLVSGPYTVLVVCPNGDDSAYTALTSQTLEDDHMVWTGCLYQEAPHLLSGSMVTPGRVAVGDSSASSTSGTNWPFSLTTFDGSFELVASSADRIAIRRNLVMSGDRTIPAVNLDVEGTALLPTPVTVTNALPDDTLTAQTYVTTRNTFAILGNRPLPAKLVPPGLLLQNERQDTSFRANRMDGNAYVTRYLRRMPTGFGAQPPVTFSELVSGLSIGPDANGDLRMSWSTSHSDFTYFTGVDFLGNYFDHLATASYVEAMGSHSITLDTQLPGYLDSWRLDLSAYTYSVSAAFGTVDTVGRASYSRGEDVFSAAARRDGSIARALEQHKLRAERLRRVSLEGEQIKPAVR